jgi:hypothetical protein
MSNQGSKIGKTYPKVVLSVDSAPVSSKNAQKKLEWANRPINRTRKDIADWKKAMAQAENTETPSNIALQTIYENIFQDGLLTSQIENRISKSFNVDFTLTDANGNINDDATKALYDNAPWRDLMRAVLESYYFEYSLVELSYKEDVEGNNRLICESIPRINLLPQKGLFYYDIADPDKTLDYRSQKEYGIWWLEFGSAKRRGHINKAVPHVLMKSFAQSCWAELCEIYGIPPRYVKTNTQDPAMLNRADKMMRDMGAAAYFIIDNTEEFQFAQGVQTNGDVYKNLIQLCNNEDSMLISGAIIGQDTVNGSRSKDEAAQDVLWELVMQDLVLVEQNFNNIVLPALVKLGIIPSGLTFGFDIPEDLEKLWQRVKDAINNYDFDVEWLNEKFGLKITGVKQNNLLGGAGLSAESFFV